MLGGRGRESFWQLTAEVVERPANEISEVAVAHAAPAI
jgi:hypothetical protein